MMHINEQTLTTRCPRALDEGPVYISAANKAASEYVGRRATATRVLGVILFVCFAPLTALLIVIVRCTSRGPGLFSQVRVGRSGKLFTMYKIRTMCQDAEVLTGPVWSTEHDPRVTRLGALLRFLHLDELPQLWNVARGDMDLIGPRPERPEITKNLVQVIPRYVERLIVKPGITGIAQINLPPDSDYESVARKLYLDFHYMDTACVSLDIRILICTALRMLAVRNGLAVSVLRLQRRVPRSAVDMITPAACEANSLRETVVAAAGGCESGINEPRRLVR